MSKIRMDNFDSGDAARLVVKKFQRIEGGNFYGIYRKVGAPNVQDLFAKRFTVLEFETKVDAQNVQDLFTNRFRLFRVRDEGRCTKCSGGSESSLHRISFSIVKSLPKRSLLEHTQKDLYSGLPQLKERFSYAH
jgi:hypothetical protein